MINIIKSDLYRIFKGKTLYVILGIIILLTIISVVGMSPGHIGMSTSLNENIDLVSIEEMNSVKTTR